MYEFIKCEVPGCRSTSRNPNLTFFDLPGDKATRKKWLRIINRPDLISKSSYTRYAICDRHFFLKDMWVVRNLKPGALPMRHLNRTPKPKVQNENKKKVKVEPEASTTEVKADDPTEVLKKDLLRVFNEINGKGKVINPLCIKQEPIDTSSQTFSTIKIKTEPNFDEDR